MKKILTGIVLMILIVLLVAAFAHSDPDFLAEQSMRKFGAEVSAESSEPAQTTETSAAKTDYTAAMERMKEIGVFDDRVTPASALTRARLAVVACGILGKTEEAQALAGATVFNDVPETYWASGCINYAAQNGILGGFDGVYYYPDEIVRFEEAVKVAVCLAGLDEGLTVDPDDWAKAYLDRAQEAGLLDGLRGKQGDLMRCGDLALIADAVLALLDSRGDAAEVS